MNCYERAVRDQADAMVGADIFPEELPLEPADALWAAIDSRTDLPDVDAETLVGNAEARLGHPIQGHLRVDLLSLAEGEIAYERSLRSKE